MTSSIAYGGVPGLNHSFKGFCFVWLTWSIIVYAFSAFKDSIYCLEGFPVKESIFYNWFNVEVPGKIGFPSKIYAKMQPMLQISADLP